MSRPNREEIIRGKMDQKIIDIYEKYGNLFKINITGPIESIHKLTLPEGKSQAQLPLPHHERNLPVINTEERKEVALNPIEVKNVLRQIFCEKVSKIPDLYVDEWGTKIINKKTVLERYGDRAAIVRPGCSFRILNIGEEYYLCLDYMVVAKNHLSAAEIRALLSTFSFNLEKGFYLDGGEWKPGRIENVEGDEASILTQEGTAKVPSTLFVPDIPYAKLSTILERKGIKANFDRDIKKLGLLTVDKPPRQRMDTIAKLAAALKKTVFPIKIGDFEIDLDPNPTRLIPPVFDVRTDIDEPFSAFDHEDVTKRSLQILDGLTRHGSYEKPKTDINAIILTTKDKIRAISQLVDRLENGADKYLGMGKTFGVNLKIMEMISVNKTSEYIEECKKFVKRHDFQNADIFIIYMPEGEGKSSYDSPYYQVKKYLTKNGIPSQMLDEETLSNPRFKDLNIALNIFSKTGYTPWVLDEELKDVDLFIGLSYSSIKRGKVIEKMMAYVNVFDKYGRWKFYQGDIEAFYYKDRYMHYREIIKSSLAKYQTENPNENVGKIHIHYTQKMRRDDRETIDSQVREALPNCQTYFVHINNTQPIRLFDLSTEDGSMQRRTYVITDKNQFYMCTTGINTLNQKGMGTPKILTVSVNTFQSMEEVNLRTIAQHILSLTRLNWASTKPFCHEPITTKFAGDISYFMAVFMNDPNFSVSERLKNKPWFL